MGALRGIVGGVLGLSLLEAAVSSQAAASNAGGAFTLVSKALARIVDPTTPLIPDRRGELAAQGKQSITLAN